MADQLALVQSIFGTGADGALVVISIAIWKIERRVFSLELKINKIRGMA